MSSIEKSVIRDGLTSTKKRIARNQNKVNRPEYRENLFYSVVSVYQNYQATGDKGLVRYLTDPYAILLLLNPLGAQVSNTASDVQSPSVTCKEYYDAVQENRINEILPRMTQLEREYCSYLATEQPIYEESDVLRVLAEDRHLLWQEIRDTWNLQPDPVAISFAITAPRAKVEPVTPVIGIPYNQINPTDEQELIRFPCAVEPYTDEIVQIHKNGDTFKVFGADISNDKQDALVEIFGVESSFVIEALNYPEEIKVWDILCWNDIWFHQRPLNERLNFLWHFTIYDQNRLIVTDMEQLMDAQREFGRVMARNLNEKYDPYSKRAQILIENQYIRLRLGTRRGGGARTYLKTNDGKTVFEYPDYIEREDLGDVVEIDAKGNILRLLPRNVGTHSWIEFKQRTNFEGDYGDYTEFRMPKAKWAK